MNDHELLAAYVRENSEAAFRELVERHAGLVLAASRRQLGDTPLAEDVCQAVFTLLARKAPTLGQHTVIAGWLWRTTHYVAARMHRSEKRRHEREQEAAAMQRLTKADETWKRVEPELDQALASLNKRQLNAVLLHYMENRTHQEVAASMGLSEAAAKKQAQRGLEVLRRFFVRRGHAISLTALSATLANAGASPAAPGYVIQLANQAMTQAQSGTATMPMVSETLRAWKVAKIQMGFGVATCLLLGLLVIGQALKSPNPASQPHAPARMPAAAVQPAMDNGNQSRKAEEYFRLRVLAADNGEPIANAKLVINRVVGGEWRRQLDLTTDGAGLADIAIPPDMGRLDVGVIASGYAARYATWKMMNEDAMPREYTLKLERVTRWMGGWLRDEHQQPVAGAAIELSSWTAGDSGHRETPREREGVPFETTVTTSDAAGWWTCAVLPPRNHGGFTLTARHPAFRSITIASADKYENAPEEPPQADVAAGGTTAKKGEHLRRLWNRSVVTVMDRGITLQGHVLDPSGKPVARARVVHQPHATEGLVRETDTKGLFSFEKLDPGEKFDVAVMIDGFAPAYRNVLLPTGPEVHTVEIRLEPGAPLRLRVVDEEGQPVPKATVGLEQWGELRHVIRWEATSGEDGGILWADAPPGEALELYAVRSGWCYTRNIKVRAGGDEHTIQLRRALTLSGRITDARSGVPVPQFKVFPGYGDGEYKWERLDTRPGTNGQYQVTLAENQFPWQVRIEAEGYEPWESGPVDPSHTGYLDVVLQPVDPGLAIQGTVLEPNGRPADAQVALLTLEHNVDLVPGRFESRSGENLILRTDAGGGFKFAPQAKAHSLAAVSPAGLACGRLSPPMTNLQIRLQPWGRIEGYVLPAARRRPVASVVVEDPLRSRYEGRVSWNFSRFAASVQEDGRFVLDQVPPVPCWLLLTHGPNQTMTHRTLVLVTPGETTSVNIGCVGPTVTARLTGKGGATLKPGTNNVVRIKSILPKLEFPEGTSDLAVLRRKIEFWHSLEGLERARRHFGYYPKLKADGRFEVEELLPGDYELQVSLKDGRLTRSFKVPSDQDPCGTLDLGTLELE